MLNDITLLYVEDDRDSQNSIALLLEDEVKELYLAGDGEEGLKIFKEKRPDIILTDLNMPKMDGLTLLQKIRAIDENQPILILSALDDRENLLAVINKGGNGFLPKPIDIEELFNKLQPIAQAVIANKTREEKEQVLYKLAHYDHLTQLQNKYLFELTLDKTIQRAAKEKRELALFFIDLDNFKQINDTYGHAVGDRVLQHIAKTLQKVTRKDDTLARRSGDEFLLLIEAYGSQENLQLLANKILQIMKEPFVEEEHSFSLSLSVGISTFPNDALTAEDLIEKSDQAMYKAKESGKSTYVFFNDSP